MNIQITKAKLVNMMDVTLLSSQTTYENVRELCDLAKRYHFGAVCVNPGYAKMVSDSLKGTTIKVCIVIGFPLGAYTSESKAFEAKESIQNGASEIDMVMNVGAFLSNDFELVERDLKTVIAAAKKIRKETTIKVIIEVGLLDREQKIKACQIAMRSGADFIKTCTGFAPGQATADDVKLILKSTGNRIKVKASGKVGSYEVAVKLIEAGASRFGLLPQQALDILKGYKKYERVL